jgi:PAS domain S-box-containing protein
VLPIFSEAASLFGPGDHHCEFAFGPTVTIATDQSPSFGTEHLCSSEALYRSLVEHLPQCVFRKDLEGRYTYVNQRLCEWNHKPPEQILGTTVHDHFPQEIADKYRRDDERVVATRAVLDTIEEFRAGNEPPRYIHTLKTPVYDADGRLIGTQGIFWDITEVKLADETLERSERDFRALAENLPDIVARFDRQLRHIYVNSAIEKVTGQPPMDLIGKSNAELGHPDEVVALWEGKMREVFESAQEQTIEFTYPNGASLQYFESRLIPEIAADGRVETLLCISRDVTDRARAAQHEQALVAQLAHAARLSTVGELAAEIAHEINQPLHAIANFAQAGINVLSRPQTDSSELPHWLEQIVNQATRAAEIIRRAGRFARKTSLQRSPSDLNELIRDCLKLIEFDLHAHHVQLHWRYSPSLPHVLVDAIQIQQVLVNLIRNAIDAMEENPIDDRQLTIATASQDDEMEFTISDNGGGIGAEDIQRIFEPFFTSKTEGMGMGLAVSHSIIQAHAGRLWAENNADRGATFRFKLPALSEVSQNGYCRT